MNIYNLHRNLLSTDSNALILLFFKGDAVDVFIRGALADLYICGYYLSLETWSL
jgi:hypothetical protein